MENTLSVERRHYVAFQTRVQLAPEQCLRYCFSDGAAPLCPSPAGVPGPASVPLCPRCGGPRVFEFQVRACCKLIKDPEPLFPASNSPPALLRSHLQVMPQLLNYLGIDEDDPAALDWGTIAVYSCRASCPIVAPAEGPTQGSAYAEEFVWVQSSS